MPLLKNTKRRRLERQAANKEGKTPPEEFQDVGLPPGPSLGQATPRPIH